MVRHITTTTMLLAGLLCFAFSLTHAFTIGNQMRVVGNALPAPVAGLVKDMQSLMDTSVDPCQDFFQYTCGTYIKNHPVPPNTTTPYIDLPDIINVEKSIAEWTTELMTQPWPIINDLYATCMKSPEALNQQSEQAYRRWIKHIESADLSTAQSRLDFFHTVRFLDTPIDAMTFQKLYANKTIAFQYIVLEYIGNTIDADLYFTNSPEFIELNQTIVSSFARFEDPKQAVADAHEVLVFEAAIANARLDTDAMPITFHDWNVMTKLNWTDFLGGAAKDDDMLQVPVNFTSQIFASVPERTLRRFLEWKVYLALAESNFTQCLVDWENSPCASLPPMTQSQLCVTVITQIIPDYINMIFAVQVVNQQVVDDIHTLTDDIHRAFSESLPNIDWMAANASNIEAVRFKLANILQNIGHSSVMDKYDGVRTSPTSFYESYFSILAEKWQFSLDNAYRPYNRSEESFDAQMVNAFYDPDQNTINFPAGILESPMYSASWPGLWQYARLGYVVGHESTHGFDSDGSHYDAFGRMIDIFDAKTRAAFDEKAQCVVDYYNKFVVYGNTTINGKQTITENIADIGGVKNSWRAYQQYVARNGAEFADNELVQGMTTNQVFFTIMGQTWCSVVNDLYDEQQIKKDVHSPFKFRVIGPLAQFDEFAKAFNCPANTPMNPAERCDLW